MQRRRSRARYLAPIALVAVIVGTYLIVHDGMVSKSASPTHHAHHARGARRRSLQVRFYAVAPGDNLTSIAKRTGLTVGQLQSLNPNIDPNALQTGQRLRLRR